MRRTVVVVTALVAALAVVATVWILRSRQPESPPPQTLGPQGTVLLIPGYGGGSERLRILSKDLGRAGIRSEVVGIGDGTGDLRDYAAEVERRARQLEQQGQPAVDLIGYSAGGITARIAAAQAPELFRKVIMLGTPNHGTSLAELGAMAGACPTACQQLRPDSDVLTALPNSATPDRWLVVFSETDEVIRPPESSELDGAEVVKIQGYCPGQVGHGEVPTNSQTVASVIAFLAGHEIIADCS